MKHVKAMILLQAMLVLITASGIAIADDLHMTTYYPAPSGRYQDLTTDDLTVSGTATLSNDLSIGNNMSVGNNLTVNNDVTVSHDLAVNGAFNPQDLNVGRDLTVAQDATIAGTTNLNGIVNTNDDLRAFGGVGVLGSNLIVAPFGGRPAWLNGDAANPTAAEGFNFSAAGRVGLNTLAPNAGPVLSIVPPGGIFVTTSTRLVSVGGSVAPNIDSTVTVGGTLGVSGSAAIGGKVKAYSGVLMGGDPTAVCNLDAVGMLRFTCLAVTPAHCMLSVCGPTDGGSGLSWQVVKDLHSTGGGTVPAEISATTAPIID